MSTEAGVARRRPRVATEENRTLDTWIFSPLLYRLSYSGKRSETIQNHSDGCQHQGNNIPLGQCCSPAYEEAGVNQEKICSLTLGMEGCDAGPVIGDGL